ncbi:MAG: hypothetical protein ABI356_00585 [Steroidobacteraceae bacterium]
MTARAFRLHLSFALLGMLVGAGAAQAASDTVSAHADYSSAALYNAANAYARQGKSGLAVLDFERARVLSPNDSDILANLAVVRSSLGLPSVPGSWFARHARWANPNLLFWLGLAGLGLAGVGVLAIRFYPRQRRVAWPAAVLGVVLSSIALADALAIWPILHEAVVLHSITAQVSPITDGDTLFALPEGQIVQMTSRYPGYALVQTASGQTGWVVLANLAPVAPLG